MTPQPEPAGMPPGPIAAWVADQAITVAEIDERVAALRRGPYAARLPDPDTAEGRNVRRWLVQAATTEAVIEYEAARRGLGRTPDGAASAAGQLTIAAALATGGVAAAVLAALPVARALRAVVTPPRPVPDGEAMRYHARNRDRYPQAYPDVRDRIAAELAVADRDRRFARWLDQRHAALVRLAPGFEHPGDPRHPDAVHRH